MTELQKQLNKLDGLPFSYSVGVTSFTEPKKKYFVHTYYCVLDDYSKKFNEASGDPNFTENVVGSYMSNAEAPYFYGSTPEEAIQKCLEHYGKQP